ncbi:MAG TPA: 2-hydroxyacyl-CoA dehydratase, partial [Candidatus Cloacimonadota bacterium]|nr:2-hydroxyacyl-CoA dehydratase [Candidatus Cloacimonadota bacterium]
PVEVVYAAGHVPVDLNNIFLTLDPVKMVQLAEMKGFPRTICAWIKGNFSSALAAELDEVIAIVQGDCSNSASLSEMIREEGMPVFRFSFPPERDYDKLDSELSLLEAHFGVTRAQTVAMKRRLDRIRRKLVHLDMLTYRERKVSGQENHLWLVNASDFEGDPAGYERRLDIFLHQAEQRDPLPTRIRLAFLGVPPIFSDIYACIIEQGGDVIFNEVQRQFAMPALCEDIVEQYLQFTYPYSVWERLEDISTQLKLRQIEGVISYTQSFCHLQIDNLLLKKHLDLPFLTLEGDQPGELDSRTILRLESFFEVHS